MSTSWLINFCLVVALNGLSLVLVLMVARFALNSFSLMNYIKGENFNEETGKWQPKIRHQHVGGIIAHYKETRRKFWLSILALVFFLLLEGLFAYTLYGVYVTAHLYR